MSEEVLAEVETISSKEEQKEKKPSAHIKKKRKKKKKNIAKGKLRVVSKYPRMPFDDVLKFAKAIQDNGSGQPIRRITLFDQIGKSPDSSSSRQIVTNANKYGLVKGGYQAELLELTKEGQIATSDSTSDYDKKRIWIELAISKIDIFKNLHERYENNKLPAKQVLIDAIKEQGKLDDDLIDELTDIFIVNAQFVGILQTLAGAQRILPTAHVLDKLEKTSNTFKGSEPRIETGNVVDISKKSKLDFQNICFLITPIGDEGSEERKHADLFQGSIIEPAIEPLGLTVVRADKISEPGLISNQIIEYIFKARLVIADLSFTNPNVFYELALRHMIKLPTVQIVRKGDRIPFDVKDARTIEIDCTDIYTLVPKLETYRAEIGSFSRSVLENETLFKNPITSVFPDVEISFSKQFIATGT